MKKENPICSLLGVTQHDMALLLRVSRSQWSMYELGKRDLPVPAKMLLAEMLTHISSPAASAKSVPHIEKQQDKTKVRLERLLRENDYQQLLTAKKIASAEKKYTAQLRVLQLVDFLNSHPNSHASRQEGQLAGMARKASKAIEMAGLTDLTQYQIKRDMLEIEKLLLESKLRSLRLSRENIGDSDSF